jgi:hypothetical protein
MIQCWRTRRASRARAHAIEVRRVAVESAARVWLAVQLPATDLDGVDYPIDTVDPVVVRAQPRSL